jgi:hypothetical protein
VCGEITNSSSREQLKWIDQLSGLPRIESRQFEAMILAFVFQHVDTCVDAPPVDTPP